MLGGQCCRLLKRRKNNNKKRADNLPGPARFAPSTSASEGGALFTLRHALALRPTPIWASCRLDLVPCSPFSVSPFAAAPPCPPYPASPFPRSSERFRYRNPTNLSVTGDDPLNLMSHFLTVADVLFLLSNFKMLFCFAAPILLAVLFFRLFETIGLTRQNLFS